MTFDELVQAVYELTNRTDLVSVTKQAVKTATLKAHTIEFFSKDIFETGVEFGILQARQSFDYISFISNFRAFKYLRRVDNFTDDDTTNFFTIIKPEEILDEYKTYRTDIAYVAGRVLEIRSSVGFQFALLGCYVLPIVTEANFSSWVAELYPDVIVTEATRQIFKTIGYDEQATFYRETANDQFLLLKQSALTDVGY